LAEVVEIVVLVYGLACGWADGYQHEGAGEDHESLQHGMLLPRSQGNAVSQ
jgi:hypothetical protein